MCRPTCWRSTARWASKQSTWCSRPPSFTGSPTTRRCSRALRRVLRDDGRLVAQCGGGDNLAGFMRATDAVVARPPFSAVLAGQRPVALLLLARADRGARRWRPAFAAPAPGWSRRRSRFADARGAGRLLPRRRADQPRRRAARRAARDFVAQVVDEIVAARRRLHAWTTCGSTSRRSPERAPAGRPGRETHRSEQRPIQYNLNCAAPLGGPPAGAAERGDRDALSRLRSRQSTPVGAAAAHSAGRVPVVRAARVVLAAGRSSSSPTPLSGRARSASVRAAPRRRTPSWPAAWTRVGQWLIAQTDEVNGLSVLAWGPIALPESWRQRCRAPATSWPSSAAGATGWPCSARRPGLSLLLGGWFYRGLAGREHGRARRAAGGRAQARRGPCSTCSAWSPSLLGDGAAAGRAGACCCSASPPWSHRRSPCWAACSSAAACCSPAVHLFFAIDAIFVSDAGPLAAIQRSVGPGAAPPAAERRADRSHLAHPGRHGPGLGRRWPTTCNPRTASPWASSATRTSPAA